MTEVTRSSGAGFDWRVHTGTWRWLIFGALGSASLGCGGRTSSVDSGSSEADLQGNGGGQGGAGGTGQTRSRSVGGASGTGAGGVDPSGGTGGVSPGTGSQCLPPFEDLGGGWQRCSNGMIHRTSLGSCPSREPRAERIAPGPSAGYPGACEYDSDCTDGPNGYCGFNSEQGLTYCNYGCLTNADCDPGFACLCGDPAGVCRPASCATDADCGVGLKCSNIELSPGCGVQSFACQTIDDACSAASDCPEYHYCAGNDPAFEANRTLHVRRVCSTATCAIGRPFLVSGQKRLAAGTARADWYPAGACEAAAPPLDPGLRAAISSGWLEQALMEHASVAAFSRFSLQLLALGAPADLVAASASAMRDEIEHARACFALARRYEGSDMGPGPLSMHGALEATDLESVMLGTIAEGCIGETVAAIEAAEAAAHCEDSAARSVLEHIAADETRHAELAWRFVAWTLEVGPAALRERARAAFTTELERSVVRHDPSDSDRELARHGLIAPALREQLRARVLSEVIAPCARALLEGAPHPHVRAGASASRPLV